MIFGLHFFFTIAGYSATGLLLGRYFIVYCGASELDLGLVFMIQPITVFARPLVCAWADRLQNHKKLLVKSYFLTGFAYIPYMVIPFLVHQPGFSQALSPRVCFWICVVGHLLGSSGFCGVRSLGDALAVNYSKRIDSDYTAYRKFGSMSFGTFGYLFGFINQDWIFPDFVPAMTINSLFMFLQGCLLYLWPDEYFIMMNDSQIKGKTPIPELPNCRQVATHMRKKMWQTLTCQTPDEFCTSAPKNDYLTNQPKSRKVLSLVQQANIFYLLIKKDFRIILFFVVLFYGGLVGYAPQNFVYTYMYEYCRANGLCDSARLGGLVMICFCVAETTCYMTITAMRHRLNHTFMLMLTFISLAIHYYFYGFVLEKVSPYFFIVESLHGLEYSASLSVCVELGYKFASEVELIVPELIRRGTISQHDDIQLVKLSLMATMTACFTVVYDGFGTCLGSIILGVVIEDYSFGIAWKLIGTLATLGFITVLVIYLVGKVFHIEPPIKKIKPMPSESTTQMAQSLDQQSTTQSLD